MVDRSSRPASSPQRTATRVERRVIGLRVTRRWGPARIAFHLRAQRLAPSTVHKILRRYGCPPLAWTDPATGVRLRAGRRQVHRYEHAEPGDLVHVDIKKLGRIPDGGGHKVLGRAKGKRGRRRGMGYWYIHNAVDDRTRLAYSELLTDERKDTAAAFWQRANAHFASVGITVHRVLTDNGSCYRSQAFAAALGETITHKRTRPYRPQTNGKVERFNRTLLEEWAYAHPALHQRDRPRQRVPRLAAHLRSPPRPHRTQRTVTSRPRTQPPWTEHLVPHATAGTATTFTRRARTKTRPDILTTVRRTSIGRPRQLGGSLNLGRIVQRWAWG